MAEKVEISGRQAARRLGLSDAGLRKWRGRDDWVFGAPPYTQRQVDQIQLWAVRTLRRGVRRVPPARPGEAAAGIVRLVGAAADAAGAEPPAPRRRRRRAPAAGDLGEPADRKDGDVRAGPAADDDGEWAEDGDREDENGDELGELSDAQLEGLLAKLVKAIQHPLYAAPVRADVLLKIEKIQSERQRRRIQASEFLPRAQVEREGAVKAHSFAVGMQQMERVLGSQFAGLEQHEAECALRESHKALLYLYVGNREAGAKAWRLAEEYLNNGADVEGRGRLAKDD